MNPQNPQPQNNQGLDPSVVALTKAIGQQESGGNYNSPQGKNGETGAYQMTPGFIENYAPKFLPNYKQGQSLTPAQQDELAYNVVKEWGTSGDPSYPQLGKLTPAQIASAWNSGDPNAYLDEQMKGTNAAGASYDVPNYVSKVGQNYDKNMGISPTSQAQQSTTPQTQSDGTVGGGLVNLMRGAETGGSGDIGPQISAGVVQGLGGLAQGALDVGGALANVGRGLFGQEPQSAPQIISPQALQPQNTGEMLGNVIGGALALASPLAFTGEAAAPAAAIRYVPTAEATPAEAAALKAASTAATSEAAPSALSKIVNLGKTALGITGAEDIAGNIGKTVFNKGTGTTPQTGGGDTSGGNQQQQDISSVLSSDTGRSAIATSLLANAINNTLNTEKSGRILTASKEGQNVVGTAAMFNLVHPDENGILQFDETKRQNALKEVANLDDKIIASEGGSASPMAVLGDAGQYIGNAKLQTWEDRVDAGNRARQIIEAEAPNGINGQMSLSEMRERQKEHNAKWKDRRIPNAEQLAHRAVADAYGNTIRNNLQNPELHDRAMAMEQALIRSKMLEKKLQGKRAPVASGVWEQLLKQGARAAEIYIGDKIGGPIGAIIGGLAGESLNRRITRHFGRNIFETKGMRAAMDVLHETKPQQYNELVAALKQQGIPFTPEQEPENQNFPELVKDVGSDLKTMGDKGLVKAFKSAEKKSGLLKPPKTS